MIETNPDALSIAESMDEERAKGDIRGPLHGIPVMVKDVSCSTKTYVRGLTWFENMATKDKMHTTCGSYALLGSIVPRDAFVVAQLRKAGAIILGHANMTEWASLRSSSYSDGYSARGGQVRNPYDLSQSPCKSHKLCLFADHWMLTSHV